jgi:hypothetical protein
MFSLTKGEVMKSIIRKLSYVSACILLLLLAVFANVFRSEAAPAANLIANGDFILDTSCWRARYWSKYKIDYLVTEDIAIRTEKNGNSYQLAVPINHPSQTVRIMSDLFNITQNSSYVFSMDMKIEGNPRSVEIFILNDKVRISKSFNVSNSWQNIKFTGQIPSTSVNMCRLEIKMNGENGTAYLKSVRLEQPQTVSSYGKVVDLALKPGKPLSIFELGNDVMYTVRSMVPSQEGVAIDWFVEGLNGNRVSSGRLDLKAGADSRLLSLGKLGMGWYTLQYAFNKTGYMPRIERFAFTVVPRLADRPVVDPERSLFGVHSEITNDGLLAAKLMGFRWIRLNAPLITKWNAVEEKQGVFSYNDPAVSTLKREGFGIVGSLDRTASWASTGKDDPKTKTSNFFGAYSYLPENWGLWKKYVSATITHYKNDIRYWQIWNEPDIQFLVPPDSVSNASAYNQIVSITAPIVRSLDPGAKLLGGVAYLRQSFPGPGRQDDFLEEMNTLGTERQLNIFTFHHYVRNGENLDQSIKDLEFAKTLFKGVPLRYWLTEFGLTCSQSNKYDFQNRDSKCPEVAEAAKIAVKFNVMNFAKGVERIFFYNAFFDTNGLPDFKNDTNIMWDSKEPRPIVSAYAVLTWILDGSSFVNSSSNGSRQEYTFKNGNRSIKVVWSSSGYPQEYVLSQTAKFISLDGSNTFTGKTYQITDEPVYVILGS